jgi:hypothetical protein
MFKCDKKCKTSVTRSYGECDSKKNRKASWVGTQGMNSTPKEPRGHKMNRKERKKGVCGTVESAR